MFGNGKSGDCFLSMDAPGSFGCVNHFDGCNQLFKHSQLLNKHKKLCSKRSNILYECPICIETIKYCSYNLCMHFKEEHPKLFLPNTAMFNVEVESELQRTYLYSKNDLLFFIRVSYCKSDEEFTLNTLYLGSKKNAWKISQNFTLQTIDGKVRYTIKGKHCSAVNGKVFEKKIQICVDDFPKNVVVCEFDLNTEHVDTMPILPKDYKQKCVTLAPVNGEDISVESIETALKSMTIYETATKSVGTIPKERPFDIYTPTRQPRRSYSSSSQYEPDYEYFAEYEFDDCPDYEYFGEYEFDDCPDYEYFGEYEFDGCLDYECFSEY